MPTKVRAFPPAVSFFSLLFSLLAVHLGAVACSASSRGAPLAAGDPAADDADTSAPYLPPSEAAVTATEPAQPQLEAASAAAPDGAVDASSAEAVAPSPDASALDAGPGAACDAALGPGDLIIDELMIESVNGSGDYGEWLEVTSTLDCAIDLRGLHGECPRGSAAATFDVSNDVWVPARGSFVVADSIDPAVDHYLPGTVVGWLGHPGDVLRNMGTTVTLSVAGAVIDTLTYPALALTVGSSLEFPGDCDPTQRADFTRWQTSTSSWFPGFHGTPNAPNTDVSCAD